MIQLPLNLDESALVHTFEPSGLGMPVCIRNGCGRMRTDRVHPAGRVRTRIVLAVDHDNDVTVATALETVQNAVAAAPVVTLTHLERLP